MKNIFTTLLFFAAVFTMQAQTELDKKLLKRYSPIELEKLKKDSPQEYKFAKYCINNAFYIAAFSKEKAKKSPNEYGDIEIKDLSNINFFELNIDLKQTDHQAFVIQGTSKVLIVRSKDFILKELIKKQP